MLATYVGFQWNFLHEIWCQYICCHTFCLTNHCCNHVLRICQLKYKLTRWESDPKALRITLLTRIHSKCNKNLQRIWKDHWIPLWIVWLREDIQSGEDPSPYQYHEIGVFVQWYRATSYFERNEWTIIMSHHPNCWGGWWWWFTCASNKALPHGRRLLNFETHNNYVYREVFVNLLVLSISVLFWIFFYRYHHLPNIYNAQLLGWERNERKRWETRICKWPRCGLWSSCRITTEMTLMFTNM